MNDPSTTSTLSLSGNEGDYLYSFKWYPYVSPKSKSNLRHQIGRYLLMKSYVYFFRFTDLKLSCSSFFVLLKVITVIMWLQNIVLNEEVLFVNSDYIGVGTQFLDVLDIKNFKNELQ